MIVNIIEDDRPRYMVRIAIVFGLIGAGSVAYFGVPELLNDVINLIGNTGNNSNTLPVCYCIEISIKMVLYN